MPHPASRDGAIDGINRATLSHVPVVPPGINPGPSHDVTYNELHLEWGTLEPNNVAVLAKNSTCYKKSNIPLARPALLNTFPSLSSLDAKTITAN